MYILLVYAMYLKAEEEIYLGFFFGKFLRIGKSKIEHYGKMFKWLTKIFT